MSSNKGKFPIMNAKVIAQGALNLVIRRYAGPFWYRRCWLNRTQWFSKEQLEILQLDLLKRIVRHAERNVPYYQEVMDKNGFSASNIVTLEDIKLFPILTKKDVIEAGDKIVSRAYPKFLSRHAFTGGTSGTPLHLFRSPFSIGNEHAFVRRQWDWAGLGFKDVCAFAKGRIIENDAGYLYDPIMKELHFSTYHMTLDSAKRYLSLICDYQCKGLVGYPSSIFLLAKAKSEMNIKLPIKSILLTSETLTDDIRAYISQIFSVNIYDFYGAAERVCYIFTCEKGSYHLQPEYGLDELIPVDDKGTCKVISTGFWNLAMPLIRYDTGDWAALSEKKCSCKRQFQVVDKICGREGDYIRTPSGNTLGVSILTHSFHVTCGIDTFVESQIIQDRIDHLMVTYVPSSRFKKEKIQEYKSRLNDCIGLDIDIDFVQVQGIPKTKSGKHKFVVSKIEDSKL